MKINKRDLLKTISGAVATTALASGTSCKSRKKLVVEKVPVIPNVPSPRKADKTFFVQIDQERCVGCDSCVEVCPTGTVDGPPNSTKNSIDDIYECMACGQCIVTCPYNAPYETVSFINEVREALKDPDKKVIAMPAPAVRYAIGEPFGMEPGSMAAGKMWTALRELGFDYLWDVEFGADLTIIEEGTEFARRINGRDKKPLPQFTSCCPAWIRYVESFYPELFPHLSTAKSPVGMLAALAKTYGAEKTKVKPENIFTVSIMPCMAKKFECLRPEMDQSGYRDTDATITTRELAYLIKEAGIDFASLKESEADPMLGTSTGAGTIFGVTGGVMEAALRFAYETLSGKKLQNVDLKAVRGTRNVREADIALPDGRVVKVCMINGMSEAKPILEQVKNGTSPYHFIEVMNCPGGCVNGGGQPLRPDLLAHEGSFIRRKAADFMKVLSDLAEA